MFKDLGFQLFLFQNSRFFRLNCQNPGFFRIPDLVAILCILLNEKHSFLQGTLKNNKTLHFKGVYKDIFYQLHSNYLD